MSKIICPFSCKSSYKKWSEGFGLVEMIVGVSIVTLALLGIISTFSFYIQTGQQNVRKIKGMFLMEEGIEVVRSFRDGGWDANIATLTRDTPYHLFFTGSSWQATTTPQTISGLFMRTVTLSDVYRRDSDDDIVASTSPDSKTIDPDTVEVRVRVTGFAGERRELVITGSTYLADIFNN